jgi:hypothetical protein
VKYWSMLVCGMANREMDLHRRAATYLKEAAGEKAKPAVRMQAAFEIGRNLAEWGQSLYEESKALRKENLTSEVREALAKAEKRFGEAEKAIGQFRELTAELLGKNKSAKLQADIYATILSNYLYETWADSLRETDPAEAEAMADKGLEVVLTFLENHEDPAVQQFLLSRIAGKYQGRTDYQNMPSIFVYSIALKKLTSAEDLWRDDKKDAARQIYDEVTKMMELIESRDDTSKDLRKRVGSLQAYISNKLGNELDAARKFWETARTDPSGEGAFTAATNALKIYRKMIQRRPTPKLKKEFIKALEFFLEARDGAWAKRAAQWHFDLAWQLESLAETQGGQVRKNTYLRAVKAYRNVPKSTPEYMQAQYRSLSLQMKIIDTFGTKALGKSVRDLIEEMDSFVTQAKSAIASTDDEGKKKDMREWAARARFESAILISETLGQDQRALALMRRLPEEWPGTRVLRWAAAFRIERLMKTGEVQKAFAEYNQFRRKYGEEKARGLVQSLIREVRDNIDKLSDGTNPQLLATYRKVYARFAENLYKTSADESDERRYPLKQMYADALLERGHAARRADDDPNPFYKKALEIYQELREHDQKEIKARRVEINRRFDEKVAAVKDARGSVPAMIRLGKQYLQEAAADDYTSVSLTLLSDAVAELDEAIEDADIQQALSAVELRMGKFLADYRRWKLGRVPVDGSNILGLARSHRLLDAPGKAKEQYEKWIRSAPRSHPQWWDVQYEYSQTVYELNTGSREVLKKLRTKIRQLKASSASMGGQRNNFDLLLRQVNRALGD